MIGCTYGVLVGFILFFVGKYFAYLFISDNAEVVIPMVETYLQCVGIFMIPLYVVNSYRNGFQGMGYGLLPMLSGVAELVGRGIMAIVASNQKSYTMACMASPFAWIIATVLLIGLLRCDEVMKDIKQVKVIACKNLNKTKTGITKQKEKFNRISVSDGFMKLTFF